MTNLEWLIDNLGIPVKHCCKVKHDVIFYSLQILVQGAIFFHSQLNCEVIQRNTIKIPDTRVSFTFYMYRLNQISNFLLSDDIKERGKVDANSN